MKISKFVSLVLVAFVGAGLIAPQQARAVQIEIGVLDVNGLGFITPANTQDVPHTFTTSTAVSPDARGIFAPLFGASLDFIPITWTGIDPQPPVLQGAPVMSWWHSGGFSFDLLSLQTATFNADSVSLTGEGTVHVPTGASFFGRVDFFEGGGIGEFNYAFDMHLRAFTTPEGGSALVFLAAGLLSLVAVEGLRRKIGAVQNR
jgi:hypothetical protein